MAIVDVEAVWELACPTCGDTIRYEPYHRIVRCGRLGCNTFMDSQNWVFAPVTHFRVIAFVDIR